MSELDYQTIIIGAGISGIGAGIELDKNQLGTYCILEASDNIAGTWRSNKYPGVAVDIPSFAYQFSYEPNYQWSKMFAEGDEIEAYIHKVAEKYQIKQHIQFDSHVKKTHFNNTTKHWTVTLDDGSELQSRYIIAATGIFHQAIIPDIPGRDRFKGKTMHPSNWDHSYNYSGKKVGIIGTGASAVQIIPSIAPKVDSLSVFQRTPIWIMPKNKKQFSMQDRQHFEENPSTYEKIETHTRNVLNLMWKSMLLAPLIPFSSFFSTIPMKIFLKQQVNDPAIRKKLTPTYAFGCKRPAISNDYLKAFNRSNVILETDEIKCITETGVETIKGKHIDLDFLIYSTGYEATKKGNFPSFSIIGSENISLADYWEKEGYQSYNGVGVPSFPNLFLTSGPFSFGLNWYDQLESNLHLTIRVLKEAQRQNTQCISIDKIRNQKHYEKALKKASKTLQLSKACNGSNSYYIDAKGQNSLPAVVTPNERAKKVKNMDLGAFIFS